MTQMPRAPFTSEWCKFKLKTGSDPAVKGEVGPSRHTAGQESQVLQEFHYSLGVKESEHKPTTAVLQSSGRSPVFDGLQGDAGGFGAEREVEVERQALLGALGLGTLAALWI